MLDTSRGEIDLIVGKPQLTIVGECPSVRSGKTIAIYRLQVDPDD